MSICIVCHDAGGAEILSSWALKQSESLICVLDGPAISIFQRKNVIFEKRNLKDAINKSDWIICGTSWQSNLEKNAIIYANKINRKVVSFLDHWVNYRERFILKGKIHLPSEIWVGDNEAKIIARKEIPEAKIILYNLLVSIVFDSFSCEFGLIA